MADDLTPPEEIKQRSQHCFGCGPENPQGLHLTFILVTNEAGQLTATTSVELTRLHEGPPGYIHGGIIATLLDEAMSKLNRPLNVLAMTRSLSVDYLRPSPLGVPLQLIARHIRQDGRKILHEADLLDQDGTQLAHAEGFFLVIPPGMLATATAAAS